MDSDKELEKLRQENERLVGSCLLANDLCADLLEKQLDFNAANEGSEKGGL